MNSNCPKFLVFMLLLITSLGFSQTPGLIYKPAGNALGKSVLDPNGDGYSSPTVSGFSGTDYGSGSELNMVALPSLNTENSGDILVGPAGGHTDLVSNGTSQSSYVMFKTVGGTDYLIVRFRLGGSSTAPKGYSLLLDTDNNSNNNYSAGNPCFEREIILQSGVGIVVNSLNASVTQLAVYDADNYQQRSVALSTNNSNPDYFYDFFVPISSLGISGPVRMLLSSVFSPGQSGINGTLSDINGVDDSLYGGNTALMIQDVISTFPASTLSNLISGASFATVATTIPSITSSIVSNSTTISGVSQESNGTVITVYKNGSSIGTTTVTSKAWTLTGVSGLVAGNSITATALATSRTISGVSTVVEVTGVQMCFTAIPVITSRVNGSQVISGTWSYPNGTFPATNTTVVIKLYDQTAANTFTEITSASVQYVLTNGTWSFTTNISQSAFNGTTIYAKAIIGTCSSGYSNVSFKSSGQGGTATAAPTITTSQIIASPTIARSVTVTNNDTTASFLVLYINGNEVSRTTSTIAAGGSNVFSYTGFIDGDVVIARAQSATTSHWLSNPSSSVTVIASLNVSDAPVITSTVLTSGSGKTITGTSAESAGATVYVYKSGTTLLGTTTVNSYGSWSLASLTLAAADVITATAKAVGETTSVSSNSVTVVASLTAAPVVASPIYVGATTISGTGGVGTTTIYVDGASVGTATGASWTLTGINPLLLYRGATVSAINTLSGVPSASSNVVTVLGAASFCITDTAGNAITSKSSGELFNIRITAITGTVCPGTTYTGYTGTVVLSSSTTVLSGAGQTLNFVNGVLTSTAVALGVPGTPITLSVISTTDPTATGSISFNLTSIAWKGTTSTDFNTASNWVANVVPVSGAYILYNSPTDRDCVLDQNRTVAAINFNGTTKNLNLNGKTLTVNGAISGISSTGGMFTGGSTSSLVFGGSGNVGTFYMDQTTPLTSNVLDNLTVNALSSGSVTLGNTLNISGILAANAGTLNTGNFITFKSNATKTAIVSAVTGTISGEVTVERYVPAKRAFRFLSSPVTTTTSIRDNWQEGQNNSTTISNSNNAPGWGTHITGSTSGLNGFDATQTTNSSMFAFVNSTGSWASGISNTDVITLTAGVPYRLLIRGNRSVDLNSNTATPSITTLRAKGTLVTGAKVVTGLSTAANGDNFIGNPYQAPVDMNALLQASTNLNKTFYYVWDPNVNTRGGYVAVNVGTGVSNNLSSAANKYLQPWQGCFVKTDLAGAATLTFQESYKQTNTTNINVFRKANTQVNLRLKLYEASALLNNQTAADALLIEFGSDNNNAVDGNDADKYANLDEDFSSNNNGKLLSIEARALPQLGETIPLSVSKYRNTNYTIVAEANNIDGLTPVLYDKYTQTSTEIPESGAVNYNYSVVATDAQSTSSSRFDIVFKTKNELGTQTNELASGLELYPNPVNEGWFVINSLVGTQDLEVQIFNVLGQKIDFTISNLGESSRKIEISKSVTKGIYLVKIKQKGQTSTKKILIN